MKTGVRRARRPPPGPPRLARPGRSRIKTDPRFTRRRRAVERAKRRRVFVRAGVLAGIAGLAWALFMSPLLAVREVAIVGAGRTSDADVVDAASLSEDDNLLLLSGDPVVGRVEALPWVRTARLDRMLPGTVRIRITERRPAMVLSLGAARWTIDSSGRVLQSGSAAKHLPILAGVQIGAIEPGLRLQTSEADDALAAYRSLPPSIRRRVAGVFAPTIERITFSLDDQTQVRYGAAEDMDAKNEVLKAIFKRLGASPAGVAYIDVRVPARPAVAGQGPPGPLPTD